MTVILTIVYYNHVTTVTNVKTVKLSLKVAKNRV